MSLYSHRIIHVVYRMKINVNLIKYKLLFFIRRKYLFFEARKQILKPWLENFGTWPKKGLPCLPIYLALRRQPWLLWLVGGWLPWWITKTNRLSSPESKTVLLSELKLITLHFSPQSNPRNVWPFFTIEIKHSSNVTKEKVIINYT